MARRLNPREIRVLQLGGICAVAILAFTYGADWLGRWGAVRASLGTAKSQLGDLAADNSKRAAVLSIVPVFEPPKAEETQKFLFRDKLYEQLKKAGIKNEPLAFLATRTTRNVPYNVLRIKCKGKCQFNQLLDFLAALKENPYLVGVEELSIQCDTKEPPEKRKEVEIDLTVSTFVEKPRADRVADEAEN
jgi:hypothetical protein